MTKAIATYQIDNHDQVVPSQAPNNEIASVKTQPDEKGRDGDLQPHHTVEDGCIVCGSPHGAVYLLVHCLF